LGLVRPRPSAAARNAPAVADELLDRSVEVGERSEELRHVTLECIAARPDRAVVRIVRREVVVDAVGVARVEHVLEDVAYKMGRIRAHLAGSPLPLPLRPTSIPETGSRPSAYRLSRRTPPISGRAGLPMTRRLLTVLVLAAALVALIAAPGRARAAGAAPRC